MDNIGGVPSAKGIADFLKAQRRSASVYAVRNYLAHLDQAVLRPVTLLTGRRSSLLQSASAPASEMRARNPAPAR